MDTFQKNSQTTGNNAEGLRFTQIRKRDGRLVPFDAGKIESAILKAGHATGEFGENIAQQLTIRVLSLTQMMLSDQTPTVEKIQDLVEEVLLNSSFKQTAKAYILYREQRTRVREILNSADCKLINDYLNLQDWRVHENSNMDYSLQGLNNYISSKVSKTYWFEEIYPREVRAAHDSGQIHVHDSGIIAPYCVGWDLQDLLLSGFQGAPGKVASKPAKHFRAILGQIVNFLYTLQGEAAGAQAFSNVDTRLAPFIRYDGLSYEAVKQALQEWLYSLNVPTRSGGQTPFTNSTFDLQPPNILANEPVIIGGELQKETYSSTVSSLYASLQSAPCLSLKSQKHYPQLPYPNNMCLSGHIPL